MSLERVDSWAVRFFLDGTSDRLFFLNGATVVLNRGIRGHLAPLPRLKRRRRRSVTVTGLSGRWLQRSPRRKAIHWTDERTEVALPRTPGSIDHLALKE